MIALNISSIDEIAANNIAGKFTRDQTLLSLNRLCDCYVYAHTQSKESLYKSRGFLGEDALYYLHQMYGEYASFTFNDVYRAMPYINQKFTREQLVEFVDDYRLAGVDENGETRYGLYEEED